MTPAEHQLPLAIRRHGCEAPQTVSDVAGVRCFTTTVRMRSSIGRGGGPGRPTRKRGILRVCV